MKKRGDCIRAWVVEIRYHPTVDFTPYVISEHRADAVRWARDYRGRGFTARTIPWMRA